MNNFSVAEIRTSHFRNTKKGRDAQTAFKSPYNSIEILVWSMEVFEGPLRRQVTDSEQKLTDSGIRHYNPR